MNGIDRQYPDYVEYSNVRIPTKGVKLNLDPDFLVGCDCTDGCRVGQTRGLIGSYITNLSSDQTKNGSLVPKIKFCYHYIKRGSSEGFHYQEMVKLTVIVSHSVNFKMTCRI